MIKSKRLSSNGADLPVDQLRCDISENFTQSLSATRSEVGILKAVADAIKKALNDQAARVQVSKVGHSYVFCLSQPHSRFCESLPANVASWIAGVATGEERGGLTFHLCLPHSILESTKSSGTKLNPT